MERCRPGEVTPVAAVDFGRGCREDDHVGEMNDEPHDVDPPVDVPFARQHRLDRFHLHDVLVARPGGIVAGVSRQVLAVVRQYVEYGELVVRRSGEARDLGNVVGHPGNGAEFVLRDLVDLLEVDDVLEQSRVLNRSECERRQAIVVANTKELLE